MAEKKVKKTTEKVEKVVKKDFKTMDELVMSLGEEAVFGFKRGQHRRYRSLF